MDGILLDVKQLDATFFTDVKSAKDSISLVKNLLNDFLSSVPSDFSGRGTIMACETKINDINTCIEDGKELVESRLQQIYSIENNKNSLDLSTFADGYFEEEKWYDNLGKKTFATGANLVAGFGKGFLSFGEGLLDTGAMIVGGAASLAGGIFDIFSGDWSFSSAKSIWKDTKALTSTNYVNKLSDTFYNSKVGKWLDNNAYSWGKSDGIGCQISQGLGYMTGVVLTGGAVGGLAGVSTTVGASLVATTAGIGKYTTEEWNKNTININGSNGADSLTVDYNKFREIQKLDAGQSTVINREYYDEYGNKKVQQYSVVSNGDGTYSMTDTYGNSYTIDKDGGMVESNDLKGLAVGTVKGLWEGVQYGIGMKIGTAQFTKMTGSIANPILKKVAVSGTRIGLDSLTGAAEVPFQSLVDSVANKKSYSQAWNDAGGWQAVGSQTLIAGIGSAVGETGVVQKGGQYAGRKLRNLWDSITDSKAIETGPVSSTATRKEISSAIDEVIGDTSTTRTTEVEIGTKSESVSTSAKSEAKGTDTGVAAGKSHKTLKERADSFISSVKKLLGADDKASIKETGDASVTKDIDTTTSVEKKIEPVKSADDIKVIDPADAKKQFDDAKTARVDAQKQFDDAESALKAARDTGEESTINEAVNRHKIAETQLRQAEYRVEDAEYQQRLSNGTANEKVVNSYKEMVNARNKLLTESSIDTSKGIVTDSEKTYKTALDNYHKALEEGSTTSGVTAAAGGAFGLGGFAASSFNPEVNAKQLDGVVSLINNANPSTSNSGMAALREYVNTGDISYISRAGDARQIVEGIGRDGVEKYLLDYDIEVAQKKLDVANSNLSKAQENYEIVKNKADIDERRVKGEFKDKVNKDAAAITELQNKLSDIKEKVNDANSKVNEAKKAVKDIESEIKGLEDRKVEIDEKISKKVSSDTHTDAEVDAEHGGKGTEGAEGVSDSKRKLDEAQQKYDDTQKKLDEIEKRYNDELKKYNESGKKGTPPNTDELVAARKELKAAENTLNIEKAKVSGEEFNSGESDTPKSGVKELSKSERERIIDMVQRKETINEILSPDDLDNIEAIKTMINNKHGDLDGDAAIDAFRKFLNGEDMPRATDAYGMVTKATDSVDARMRKWDNEEVARTKIEAYLNDYDLKQIADKVEKHLYENRAVSNAEKIAKIEARETRNTFAENVSEKSINYGRRQLSKKAAAYDVALKKYNDAKLAFESDPSKKDAFDSAYKELNNAHKSLINAAEKAETLDYSLKGLSKEISDIDFEKGDIKVTEILDGKYKDIPVPDAVAIMKDDVADRIDLDKRMIYKRGFESSDDDFSSIETISNKQFINQESISNNNATITTDAVVDTSVNTSDTSTESDTTGGNSTAYGGGGSSYNSSGNYSYTDTTDIESNNSETVDTDTSNIETISDEVATDLDVTDDNSTYSVNYYTNYNNNGNDDIELDDISDSYMDEDMNFESDLSDDITDLDDGNTIQVPAKDDGKSDAVKEDNGSNIWGGVLSGAAAIGGAALVGKVSYDAVKKSKDNNSIDDEEDDENNFDV